MALFVTTDITPCNFRAPVFNDAGSTRLLKGRTLTFYCNISKHTWVGSIFPRVCISCDGINVSLRWPRQMGTFEFKKVITRPQVTVDTSPEMCCPRELTGQAPFRMPMPTSLSILAHHSHMYTGDRPVTPKAA